MAEGNGRWDGQLVGALRGKDGAPGTFAAGWGGGAKPGDYTFGVAHRAAIPGCAGGNTPLAGRYREDGAKEGFEGKYREGQPRERGGGVAGSCYVRSGPRA